MTDRRVPVRLDQSRFGRRASDAGAKARFYAAAFVAQVAGLSLPRERAAPTYAIAEPHPPKGLFRDEKA
jgi:hypothetical protein